MLITVTCHMTMAEQFDWLRPILTKIEILIAVQDMRQLASKRKAAVYDKLQTS